MRKLTCIQGVSAPWFAILSCSNVPCLLESCVLPRLCRLRASASLQVFCLSLLRGEGLLAGTSHISVHLDQSCSLLSWAWQGADWDGTAREPEWGSWGGRCPVGKCWPAGRKHLKWLSGISLRAFICNPGRAHFLKSRWKCIPAILRRPHLEGLCPIKVLPSLVALQGYFWRGRVISDFCHLIGWRWSREASTWQRPRGCLSLCCYSWPEFCVCMSLCVSVNGFVCMCPSPVSAYVLALSLFSLSSSEDSEHPGVTAVCPWANGDNNNSCLIGLLSEMVHVKHLARCLAYSRCSISCNIFFHNFSFCECISLYCGRCRSYTRCSGLQITELIAPWDQEWVCTVHHHFSSTKDSTWLSSAVQQTAEDWKWVIPARKGKIMMRTYNVTWNLRVG